MARSASKNSGGGNGTTLGFEATLWAAADALRNNMDAAEYKRAGVKKPSSLFDADRKKEDRAELKRFGVKKP